MARQIITDGPLYSWRTRQRNAPQVKGRSCSERNLILLSRSHVLPHGESSARRGELDLCNQGVARLAAESGEGFAGAGQNGVVPISGAAQVEDRQREKPVSPRLTDVRDIFQHR